MKTFQKIYREITSNDRDRKKYGYALVVCFGNEMSEEQKQKIQKIYNREDKRIFNTNETREEREFLTRKWNGNGWRFAFRNAIEKALQ